jgi:hypothetical protein
VEKERSGFLGAAKSKADKPKSPELCFKNSLRFIIFTSIEG